MKMRSMLAIGAAMLVVAVAVPASALAQGMWGPRGGWGIPGQAAQPLTIGGAETQVRAYLARLGNPDLVPFEIMEFSNHFYILVGERSTRTGAFELIVERNGAIRPEPGPNMMWNIKYGHMGGAGGYGMMGSGMVGGGMMGGWGGPGYAPAAPAGQPLTRDRARQILQTWLNRAFPGAKAEHGTPFYGYFTFDFERNGKTVGMASVHALTGQVWYHTWHGAFVRQKDLP